LAGISKEAQVHLEQRGLDEMSIGHLGSTEPEARRRAEQVLSQYFNETDIAAAVEAWRLSQARTCRRHADGIVDAPPSYPSAPTERVERSSRGITDDLRIGLHVRVTTDTTCFERECKASNLSWPTASDGQQQLRKVGLESRIDAIDFRDFTVELGDGIAWVPIRALQGFADCEVPAARNTDSPTFTHEESITMRQAIQHPSASMVPVPTASYAAAKEEQQRKRNAGSDVCTASKKDDSNIDAFKQRMLQAHQATQERMFACRAAAARPHRIPERVSLEHVRHSIEAAKARCVYISTLAPFSPNLCDDVFLRKQ